MNKQNEISRAATILGVRGGKSTSPAKRRAARRNAKLGGRPVETKLLFWMRMSREGRDEASGTAEIMVPQRLAVRLAHSLENYRTAMECDDELIARWKPLVDAAAAKAGGKFVGGHGISIVYPSGRRSEIRRTW